MGERVAAAFLTEQGLSVAAANLRLERGEIDLAMRDGRERVVVEVRTVTGRDDPIDAVDPAKRRHVAALARSAGADRVDLVGVRIDEGWIEIHWVPGSN